MAKFPLLRLKYIHLLYIILFLVLTVSGYFIYQHYRYSWSSSGNTNENYSQLGFASENGNYTVMNRFKGDTNELVVYKRGTVDISETKSSSKTSSTSNILAKWKNKYFPTEKVLSNDSVNYVNAVKDGIVYSNNTKGGLLTRINYDGTNEESLTKNPVDHVYVQDDWIYFIEYSKEAKNQLFRMKTDGSDKQVFLKESIIDYEFVGDWIYYVSTKNGDFFMYRMKKDGSQKQQLTKTPSWHIQVEGDWVYYLQSEATSGPLYRIPKSGGTPQKLVGRTLEIYFVYQNHIYYSNEFDWGSRGFYQSDLDGKHEKKLADAWVFGMSVEGEKIVGINYETNKPVAFDLQSGKFSDNISIQ